MVHLHQRTLLNQLKKYMDFAALLEERGIRIPCKHVCNSAGIIDIPEGDLDMVRFGITMYGMYPTDEVTKERYPVTPAMEITIPMYFLDGMGCLANIANKRRSTMGQA